MLLRVAAKAHGYAPTVSCYGGVPAGGQCRTWRRVVAEKGLYRDEEGEDERGPARLLPATR
eukprot:136589-Rhodomonas_salina.1